MIEHREERDRLAVPSAHQHERSSTVELSQDTLDLAAKLGISPERLQKIADRAYQSELTKKDRQAKQYAKMKERMAADPEYAARQREARKSYTSKRNALVKEALAAFRAQNA